MSEDTADNAGSEKPRSRLAFLFRPAVLITLTILAILVAIPLAYRASRFSGIPAIDEIVDRETEGRIEIESEENAFTIYDQVLRELDTNSSAVETPDVGDAVEALSTGGWEAAAPLAQDHLDECEALLAEWKRGTDLARGVRVQPADMEYFDLIGVQRTRAIARLAILKSARCLHEGNSDEAWLWLRALFRFSRHIGNPGLFIDRMVGAAFHAMASEQLVLWAAHEDVTADQLDLALNELREIYAMTPANSVIWKTAYLNSMRSLSSTEWVRPASDYSVLKGILFPNGEPELCRVLLRHVYANHLSQCDLPRGERTMAGAGRNLFLPTGKENPPLMDTALLEDALDRSTLALFHLPNLHGYLAATDREQARQAALELCLCVELFRRKHGEYPATLQQLVPEFLDEVPGDLFGSGPAEQMLMTRREIEEPVEEGDGDDEPLTRSWLIIYSRGPDGTDARGPRHATDDVGIRIPLLPSGGTQE